MTHVSHVDAALTTLICLVLCVGVIATSIVVAEWPAIRKALKERRRERQRERLRRRFSVVMDRFKIPIEAD